MRFGGAGTTTHQVLVAANTFEKPSHIAPVIRRNTWLSDYSFVGHKSSIMVVRYNPKFFFRNGSSDDACVIAVVGSSDKSFTLWTQDAKEPIMVV